MSRARTTHGRARPLDKLRVVDSRVWFYALYGCNRVRSVSYGGTKTRDFTDGTNTIAFRRLFNTLLRFPRIPKRRSVFILIGCPESGKQLFYEPYRKSFTPDSSATRSIFPYEKRADCRRTNVFRPWRVQSRLPVKSIHRYRRSTIRTFKTCVARRSTTSSYFRFIPTVFGRISERNIR